MARKRATLETCVSATNIVTQTWRQMLRSGREPIARSLPSRKRQKVLEGGAKGAKGNDVGAAVGKVGTRDICGVAGEGDTMQKGSAGPPGPPVPAGLAGSTGWRGWRRGQRSQRQWKRLDP